MTRYRWAWFAPSILLVLATLVVTRADASVPVATPHGVRFNLPPGFAPEAAPQPLGVLRVFTDGGEMPVRVLVEPGPARDPAHSAYGAAFSAQTYAEGFAKGLREKLKGLEATAVMPVAHDAARGGARVRFETTGPAPVLAILAAPDTDEAWRPLRALGAVQQVRCLIGAVLGGRRSATSVELQANYATSATRCGRSEAQVATFVREAGPVLFGAQVVVFDAITFFTRSATLTVFVTASAARRADAVKVADAIWASATIDAQARPDESVFDVARGTPAFDAGQLIGAVFGAAVRVLLLGGSLAFLLVRFAGLAPAKAFLSALVGLALLLVGTRFAGFISLHTTVQLVTYALVGALAYRPMTRWLAAHLKPGAAPQPGHDIDP